MASDLRGALIGCGFFAINHLHAWRDIPGAEIVALCDRDPARLATVGDMFGIPARYADAAEMMKAERLDFVDIATTVTSHRSLVEMAAGNRLAAICQKPFAATLEDARAMVAAADAAATLLMVHENFRWQTPVRAVRDAIDAGDIGTPFWGRISFRSAFDVFSGQPYLAEGERFIIEDLGIHLLDVARFLFGEVAQVMARTARVNPAIRGEDVATILLGHTGGATSIVDCSYATRLAREPFPQTLIEVDGTAGTLRLDQDYRLTIAGKDGTTTRDVAPPLLPWATRPWHNIQDSVLNIQRHWVSCLRERREPDTSGYSNIRTLALVQACYASAASSMAVVPTFD